MQKIVTFGMNGFEERINRMLQLHPTMRIEAVQSIQVQKIGGVETQVLVVLEERTPDLLTVAGMPVNELERRLLDEALDSLTSMGTVSDEERRAIDKLLERLRKVQ